MAAKCEDFLVKEAASERPSEDSNQQVWGEGLAVAIHVLLPLAIAGVIWGRKVIISRLLLQLDKACLSVLWPSFSKREKVLKWTMTHLPYLDGGLETVWKDGSQLCTLINSVVPGACPNPHRHWKKAPTHGQALAYKYLGVIPVFTDSDFNQRAINANIEKTLIEYMLSVQQAVSKISHDEELTFSNHYIARGMGLVTGEQYRKTVLYIYPNNKTTDDLLVNIRGPYNSHGVAILYGHDLMVLYKTLRRSKIDQQEEETGSFLKTLSNDFQNLITLKNNREQSCDIDIKIEIEKNRAKIMFIPRNSGVYEVCLTTNGEHIAGSPYNINVEKNRSGIMDDLSEDESKGKSKKRIIPKIIESAPDPSSKFFYTKYEERRPSRVRKEYENKDAVETAFSNAIRRLERIKMASDSSTSSSMEEDVCFLTVKDGALEEREVADLNNNNDDKVHDLNRTEAMIQVEIPMKQALLHELNQLKIPTVAEPPKKTSGLIAECITDDLGRFREDPIFALKKSDDSEVAKMNLHNLIRFGEEGNMHEDWKKTDNKHKEDCTEKEKIHEDCKGEENGPENARNEESRWGDHHQRGGKGIRTNFAINSTRVETGEILSLKKEKEILKNIKDERIKVIPTKTTKEATADPKEEIDKQDSAKTSNEVPRKIGNVTNSNKEFPTRISKKTEEFPTKNDPVDRLDGPKSVDETSSLLPNSEKEVHPTLPIIVSRVSTDENVPETSPSKARLRQWKTVDEPLSLETESDENIDLRLSFVKRREFWNKISSTSTSLNSSCVSLNLNETQHDRRFHWFNRSQKFKLCGLKDLRSANPHQFRSLDFIDKRRSQQRSESAAARYGSLDDLYFPSVKDRRDVFVREIEDVKAEPPLPKKLVAKVEEHRSENIAKPKKIKHFFGSIHDKIKLFDNGFKPEQKSSVVKVTESKENLETWERKLKELPENGTIKTKIKERFEKAQLFFKTLENVEPHGANQQKENDDAKANLIRRHSLGSNSMKLEVMKTGGSLRNLSLSERLPLNTLSRDHRNHNNQNGSSSVSVFSSYSSNGDTRCVDYEELRKLQVNLFLMNNRKKERRSIHNVFHN